MFFIIIKNSIIDFIEKSPEFKLIKEHYLYLLEISLFEQQLKRISNLVSKYKTYCYINFNSKNSILQSIILHLTLAGIKVLPAGSVDDSPKTTELKYNYKLQLLFSDRVEQLPKDEQEKIKPDTILLITDKPLSKFGAPQPFNEEIIDFSLKEQYFSNVFRILEKLLVNIDCSKFITEFKQLRLNIISSNSGINSKRLQDTYSAENNISINTTALQHTPPMSLVDASLTNHLGILPNPSITSAKNRYLLLAFGAILLVTFIAIKVHIFYTLQAQNLTTLNNVQESLNKEMTTSEKILDNIGISYIRHKFLLLEQDQSKLKAEVIKEIEKNLQMKTIVTNIIEITSKKLFKDNKAHTTATNILSDLSYQYKLLSLSLCLSQLITHYQNYQYEQVLSEGKQALTIIDSLTTYGNDKGFLSTEVIKNAKANIYNIQALALRAQNPTNQHNIIDCFKKSLQEVPCNPYILSNFAWYLSKIGLRERANQHHKLAYKLSPNDPFLHNGIGFSYFANGAYEKAEHFYRRGLALKPDYIILSNNLAWLLICKSRAKEISLEQKNKLLAEAKQILSENLKKNIRYGITHHDYIHSYYYLGIISTQQGQHDSALDAFEKAKNLCPEAKKKLSVINDCIRIVRELKNTSLPSSNNMRALPIIFEDYPVYYNDGAANDSKLITAELKPLLEKIAYIITHECENKHK